MPMIQYSSKTLGHAKKNIIDDANEIIDDLAGQGYDLTLRQLYYKFVAKDLFPDDRRWRWDAGRKKWVRDPEGTKNAEPNYKYLGDVVSDGRRAGLIDWQHIVDRTRFVRRPTTWENVSEVISACADQFDVDLWEDQPYRPEAWIEKDALVGVLEVSCQKHQIPYLSTRGYSSDTLAWQAAQRLKKIQRNGQTPVIFHLGDHDASGVDMTRDIRERIKLFGVKVEVRRLALNMDQIEEYGPPPNPAKETDPRNADYRREYGDESWELDALDPATITDLIHREAEGLIDLYPWNVAIERREEGRAKLRKIAETID